MPGDLLRNVSFYSIFASPESVVTCTSELFYQNFNGRRLP